MIAATRQERVAELWNRRSDTYELGRAMERLRAANMDIEGMLSLFSEGWQAIKSMQGVHREGYCIRPLLECTPAEIHAAIDKAEAQS